MLADDVAVIDRGQVVQRGSAAELLESPATPFVAEFAGTNYLPGIADGRLVLLERGGRVVIPEPAVGPVAVLIAPWEVTLSLAAPDGGSALNVFCGAVERVVVFGEPGPCRRGRHHGRGDAGVGRPPGDRAWRPAVRELEGHRHARPAALAWFRGWVRICVVIHCDIS